MKFLPRDICEKLVEKGCVSESRAYWFWDGCLWVIRYGDDFHPKINTRAFIFQDFCGISEQAKKNCEILWPGRWNCNCPFYTDEKSKHCDTGVFIDEYNFTRERMLKMTEDEWVEFIRGAVE